jgi:hypothetical protein
MPKIIHLYRDSIIRDIGGQIETHINDESKVSIYIKRGFVKFRPYSKTVLEKDGIVHYSKQIPATDVRRYLFEGFSLQPVFSKFRQILKIYNSITISTASASPHEVTLVDDTLDACFLENVPEKIIGDRAYDSDKLDKRLAENEALNWLLRTKIIVSNILRRMAEH